MVALTGERKFASIREYFNYRDEINTQNGLLYEDQRVIIPKATRPDMLHVSHMGRESCIRYARGHFLACKHHNRHAVGSELCSM